jgi:2,3-bisphosphoglycerate-independent phosphoglycerate mutase
VISDAVGPVGPIRDGDGVLFFNFRGDRAIEISRAFEDEHFDKFARGPRPQVVYAGMMQYDGDLQLPKRFVVAPPAIDRTVGEHLAANGLRTFACSETQKYGHVTYFFNGNRSGLIDDQLEEYVQIPSDTAPFEERPWMKAAEVADAVVAAIQSRRFDHVRVNFANGDMVGHTGLITPTRISVAAVDLQLARIERAVREVGGVLLVTADHGNADEKWMREKGKLVRGPDGRIRARPSHSLAPVPFIVIDPAERLTVRRDLAKPGIAQIGATLLELCGLQAPADYLPGLVHRIR